MALRYADIPEFPDYETGQSDHEFMAHARSRGPLARDQFGIVSAFSMANMEAILDDRWTRQIELEVMHAAGVTGGPMYEFVRDVMLFSNGADHRSRRGPLARTFAHKVVGALRPEVAVRVDHLTKPLAGRGSIDFLAEIAGPLPARIIAAIIGAPEEDADFFAAHVYSAIRGLSIVPDDVRAESSRDMGELDRYMRDLIAQRQDRPAGDLLTEYLARVRGGEMDENEVRAQIVALLVAGSDTTRGALTATVSQLLTHRDQWELVVSDPEEWAPRAVSEGLRFDPVIGSLARITTEAREFEGYDLPAGTIIAASMLTALRDPEVYADPDRFDITRDGHPRLHPIFGGGPHRCLGEVLARIELEEALKALARNLPQIELDGPPATLRGYGAVREISGLRVRV